MNPTLIKADIVVPEKNVILIADEYITLSPGFVTEAEESYLRKQWDNHKKDRFVFDRLGYWIVVQIIKPEKNSFQRIENSRKAGDTVIAMLNEQKATAATIIAGPELKEASLAFAEGMLLGGYQFSKYKSEKESMLTMSEIGLLNPAVSEKEINELSIVTEAVYRCRDLINEPNSYLTASVFAAEIEKLAFEAGVKVESLNKKKIESLKMGGLLGVNKGSFEPPLFMILEWKPEDAVNKRPVVLVGKGVMYDTGGMNLKPGESMANMKDDMSGAAAVTTTLIAIAKAKLPIHVIALVPATDNRPGPEAIVSGDILVMHNGMTVEVINTDAEGRLVLADALSYAARYMPLLIIDLATLTGAAVRAVGSFGIVAIQQDADEEIRGLQDSGWHTWERIAEFPNWDEYGELMKSDVADLKNLGPPEAGAITAGKFLQFFTSYPHIHLDIAGPAFLTKRDSYRGMGGTGVGVRLLFDFLKRMIK